ncbi:MULTISPECIES: acyl carrier protein [Paraburkholderia]|jgi:acyl carrier protein|uniref:Acyl carrier protein n=1 Tax=Paraburkholderia phenazinium TaxID=60549 RepID=A0A1N6GWF0_9BURK|nr:phosphopantetheine-binding protein [Paraburkholderia phenazinium]SIO11846.1 acyl carrier protein [Paraburkholderia phenazinium]
MNVSRQEIVERLRNIVATRLDVDISPDRIGLTDGFLSVVGIDSVGFIELRYQCEEEFGIRIDENDFVPDNFLNCDVLSGFLLTKLSAL